MARVLITGSADGLGRAAAQNLLDDGHQVVVHARSDARLAAVRDLVDRGAASVVGDLADADDTRGVAEQVNRLGRMDAVIHNAGVSSGPSILPVNVVAPYLLTALLDRPSRLVCSYSDSKLLVTTLTAAVARLWPDVLSNAVDPGWVPTRMGGPGASDDLRLGHVTQVWLATSDDPEARGSGGYWYHRRLRTPHPAVHDVHFQDELLAALARSTGTPLGAGRAAAGRDGALPD